MTTNSDKLGIRTEGIAPNLRGDTVIGVFGRLQEAESAAHALRDAGFSHEELGLVMQQAEQGAPLASDETKANEGAIAGASVGAILGGALGLVALAVPGIGPLLAAGPLAAALGGALTGGAVGGVAGSFAGLSVPTEKAQEYEEAVRAGRILLSIRVPDDVSEQAARILTEQGALEVASFEPAM